MMKAFVVSLFTVLVLLLPEPSFGYSKDMCIGVREDRAKILTKQRDAAHIESHVISHQESEPLTSEEYHKQIPFYDDQKKSVDEIILLCCENRTIIKPPCKKYNFTAPDCPANNVTFLKRRPDEEVEDLEKRKERVIYERRVDLCEAILKVTSFKKRLESNTETIVQGCLFIFALICGVYLIIVGHFRPITIIDSLYPDPTKGWPFWVYEKMKYYVVPVSKEFAKTHDSTRMANALAKDRELEIDEIIESEDEKEDIYQTAAAVTDYNEFWNIFSMHPPAASTGIEQTPPPKSLKTRP